MVQEPPGNLLEMQSLDLARTLWIRKSIVEQAVVICLLTSTPRRRTWERTTEIQGHANRGGVGRRNPPQRGKVTYNLHCIELSAHGDDGKQIGFKS